MADTPPKIGGELQEAFTLPTYFEKEFFSAGLVFCVEYLYYYKNNMCITSLTNYRKEVYKMKKMVSLLSLFLIAVMITSCAGVRSKAGSDPGMDIADDHPRKEKKMKIEKEKRVNQSGNPVDIEIFEEGERPPRPYKKIGRISVKKYSALSFLVPYTKSSDACLLNLKKQAASKGGDGIIGMREDFTSMSGTVIQYTDKEIKPANAPAE